MIDLPPLPPDTSHDLVVKTFCDKITGNIVGLFHGRNCDLSGNIAETVDCVDGAYNPLTQRRNVLTGRMVNISQSEQDTNAAAISIRNTNRMCKAQIISLEISQARIIRERDLGDMDPTEANQRLRAINNEIIVLRQLIT